jgi:hypothetical protein
MERDMDEQKRIRARIKRYERELAREKSGGGYGDGAGKRYLLGPLYLLMGDLEGALRSYAWFEREFPDDSGEPGHCLCWALALRRGGDRHGATRRLGRAMLMNLYLLPRLLGEPISPLRIWHGSNLEEPDYVDQIPQEYFRLWDKEALDWASRCYHHPAFEAIRTRYVEIARQLLEEPRGPRRNRLVDESMALERSSFELPDA